MHPSAQPRTCRRPCQAGPASPCSRSASGARSAARGPVADVPPAVSVPEDLRFAGLCERLLIEGVGDHLPQGVYHRPVLKHPLDVEVELAIPLIPGVPYDVSFRRNTSSLVPWPGPHIRCRPPPLGADARKVRLGPSKFCWCRYSRRGGAGEQAGGRLADRRRGEAPRCWGGLCVTASRAMPRVGQVDAVSGLVRARRNCSDLRSGRCHRDDQPAGPGGRSIRLALAGKSAGGRGCALGRQANDPVPRRATVGRPI